MFTDEFLNDLVILPKIVVKADRRSLVAQNRNMRNNIYMESTDHKYLFTMFLRKSTVFLEDFSVGLIWTNASRYSEIKRNLILFRCQGPHDSKQPLTYDVHHSYHIHQLTSADIQQKRYTNPAHKKRQITFPLLKLPSSTSLFIAMFQE